jgi:hypothetical protein
MPSAVAGRTGTEDSASLDWGGAALVGLSIRCEGASLIKRLLYERRAGVTRAAD